MLCLKENPPAEVEPLSGKEFKHLLTRSKPPCLRGF